MHFYSRRVPDVYNENDRGNDGNDNNENDDDDDDEDNDGLSSSGYAAGRRPVVAGGTLFVITKLQKLRTYTAVTATGSRATTTCDNVGNVLALVSETERVSSASISRRGMAHALTARRRRGSVHEIESLSGRSIEWR